ncbi:MAG: hypothetical protein WAU82_23845 [Candidatus Binatus sp.]|uniref:hypothetical protein n=1 Tax=Candidatus Binatus sp. TaxID=2811406 RepID=UPI003BAE19E4
MDLIKKLYANAASAPMKTYDREQKVFSDGELACALDADIAAWLEAAPDDLKELMVAYGQSDGRVMFNVLRITVYMSAQR